MLVKPVPRLDAMNQLAQKFSSGREIQVLKDCIKNLDERIMQLEKQQAETEAKLKAKKEK